VSDYYTGASAGLPWTITDNKGNTWKQAASLANDSTITVYYAESITGGSNHQITLTAASSTYLVMTAVEYSGVAPVNSFDASNINRATSANYSSNAVTTSQSNELLIGVHHVYSATAAFTPTTPWSVITTASDGVYHEIEMQDQVATVAGAYASTGALTSSLDTQSVIVAFRSANSH
jgi:hypothetical protein